jgi:hypothetical protein
LSQLHSSLHAAALWERYNRQLFDNVTDDDELLICDFDALLNRDDYRSRWLDLLTAFLPRELGQNRTTVDAAFSNRFSLSTKSGATSESVATPQQLALYRELVEMAQHNAVRPLDGSETPGHDALFHSIYAASVTLPQLEQQLETTARSLEEQTQARHYLEGYSANQQRRIEALDEQIASMEQSLSWRVTTPLRKLQQRRLSRS